MRRLAALLLLVLAAYAHAERILLVPLDSRPAAGQFAQMISQMASVDTRLPPYTQLGRFTSPGSPNSILSWLENQDYHDVTAVVVSADMIAYGGLIASRTDEITKAEAVQRLKRLARIRAAHPEVKFYVFSSIMRLTPTALKGTIAWRTDLAKYEEMRQRYAGSGDSQMIAMMAAIKKRVPGNQVQRYERTRNRNLEINAELIRMVARDDFDFVAFGQDDARPYGPHIPETIHLKEIAQRLLVDRRVYFCEGIDQHANVLVSRAMLKKAGWTPKIRVVYSDDLGRKLFANYESKPIEMSLSDQIIASGAEPMGEDGAYDFTLYVNTPGRRAPQFNEFVSALTSDIDQGFPVAVADINLAKDGTADPELFSFLSQNDRMTRLLSFAGWNTAGNTMGTSIPAANVYLLARRLRVDPLRRELALREFLLHRYVNDYAYHKFVRPQAYQMIDQTPNATREETYGQAFQDVNALVREDVQKYLDYYWREIFAGKKFFAGTKEYTLTGMDSVKIFLPWPRAYEVRLEFHLEAQPVTAPK